MNITITNINEIDQYIEEMKKIPIWVCSTACGKTFVCERDDRFFDLDSYRGELKTQNKDNRDNRSLIKMDELLKKGKIIFNASHTYFLNYLKDNKIPFIYMYAKPELEEEYYQRMVNRGNSEEFLKLYGHLIKSSYVERVEDKFPQFKIEMNSGEFVSDYVWKIFGQPQLTKGQERSAENSIY